MTDCPPTADLERMLADDLPADRAQAVETHIAGCDRCQAELERLTDTPSSVGLDLSVTLTGRPDASTLVTRGPGPLPDIPGYLIEREVGRGGMGIVYRARQLRLNRTVALKMILAGEFASPEVTRRFLAEAEIVARIAHPNIVQVFDFGDVSGRAYFAMEYVEGGTLADRMTGQPWPPHEAAHLIEVIAGGLQRAHAAGIVHRDLKPANILLTSPQSPVPSPQSEDSRLRTGDGGRGTPKIADFGVAKLTEGGTALTLSQALIGSPSYMSPEQAAGRSGTVGPASDVWALGAVLYELLTGRKAFDGPTPLSVLEQVKGGEPPPASRVVRGVPHDLDTVVRACLEKDPARRYASAAALAEDLRRFRTGETILARPASRGQRVLRWARRHPAESGLVAALFLALGLGLLGTSWMWRDAVRERNTAKANQHRAETEEAVATEAKRAAEAARQTADEARDAWQRLTSESALARGDDLARRGDVAAGLFWMHEALRTAPPDDPHWEELVRRNLGGWEARLHALRRIVSLRGPVNAAALSPDGSLLLVGGGNGQAELWDTLTGQLAASFRGIRGGVESVAFSPDGTRAVIGSVDGVRQVDVAARKLLDPKPRIGEVGFRCAFTPDGRQLLTCSRGRTATLWDLDTAQAVRTFDTGSDQLIVWSVAVSPDGRSVAAGLARPGNIYMPAEARVWPIGGGTPVRMTHQAGVLGVRFHPGPDRVLLTACADHKVRSWDPAGGTPRGDPLTHPQRIIESAVFTPDGRAVVTTCTDGLGRWWDAATGRPLGSALRHDVGMYGAAFDAAGTQIVTYSPDHTARLWAVAPAALPGPAPLTTALRAAVAADGSVAAAVSPSHLTILDTATGELVGPRQPVPQAPDTPIAFGPGGRRLASVDRLKKLRVWEAGRLRIDTELPRKAHGLAFDPTGDRLAVACDSGVVEVWDVPGGKAVQTLRHNGVAWMSTFDPTGRWLAVGASHDPVARLWDLSGPTPTPTDLPTAEGAMGVRYRPDGWALVTRSGRVARLWDVGGRRQLGPLIGPFDQFFQIEFTPDGRALVSWSGARVRLWDATTAGPLTNQTYDHPAAVDGVALDPTGALLVAALEDRTAQFWDLRTGRPIGPTVPIGARALAVGRSADSGRFFAVGDDGKIHPLALPAPATGSVDELAARLRRKTGFTMAAGTVSPLLVKDWEAAAAAGNVSTKPES